MCTKLHGVIRDILELFQFALVVAPQPVKQLTKSAGRHPKLVKVLWWDHYAVVTE